MFTQIIVVVVVVGFDKKQSNQSQTVCLRCGEQVGAGAMLVLGTHLSYLYRFVQATGPMLARVATVVLPEKG